MAAEDEASPLIPLDVRIGIPIESRRDVGVTNPSLKMEWMYFIWAESKRISNLKSHGVDFRDAALIFQGPILTKKDTRKDYGETRYSALGMVDDECFFVAYTLRGLSYRIITAWKAGKGSKRRYEARLSR